MTPCITDKCIYTMIFHLTSIMSIYYGHQMREAVPPKRRRGKAAQPKGERSATQKTRSKAAPSKREEDREGNSTLPRKRRNGNTLQRRRRRPRHPREELITLPKKGAISTTPNKEGWKRSISHHNKEKAAPKGLRLSSFRPMLRSLFPPLLFGVVLLSRLLWSGAAFPPPLEWCCFPPSFFGVSVKLVPCPRVLDRV